MHTGVTRYIYLRHGWSPDGLNLATRRVGLHAVPSFVFKQYGPSLAVSAILQIPNLQLGRIFRECCLPVIPWALLRSLASHGFA